MIKCDYIEELREEVRKEAYNEAYKEACWQTLRRSILVLGRRRFARPARRRQKTQVLAITNMARLVRICDRLLDAASWEELLATP